MNKAVMVSLVIQSSISITTPSNPEYIPTTTDAIQDHIQSLVDMYSLLNQEQETLKKDFLNILKGSMSDIGEDPNTINLDDITII